MNRKGEVRLYRQMLGQEIPERVTLIEGVAKMGKSRLLREFRRIARQEYKVPCALVDIRTRGRNYRDILKLAGQELDYPLQRYEELAGRLQSGTSARSGGAGVDNLLHAVQQHGDSTAQVQQQLLTQAFVDDLTIISARTQIVLILDAFEQANESTRHWIADELLIRLYRLPNVVTVIAGREIPALETTWEDYAITSVLTKVTLEDFQAYCNDIGSKIPDEQIPMLYQGFDGSPGNFAEFTDALRQAED
jgi:hypothetical protein